VVLSAEILKYPDERLRKVSEPVISFDQELSDLVSRLRQHLISGPPSVGIAAPQIGCFIRVAIVDVGSMIKRTDKKKKIRSSYHGFIHLINPKLVSSEGRVIGREGCLSVPDYTGNVERAETVDVVTLDSTGKEIQLRMHGLEARAVQHEMDHLDGLLFLDRVLSPREVFRRKTYK